MKTYGSVSVNLREKWNPFFSLSCSFLPFPFCFFLLYFLIHPNSFFFFFLLPISFSHSSFSLFLHFLFSFIFSFLFSLFDPHPPNCSPPHPLSSMPHVFFTIFLGFFLFHLFPSFDTWLKVSHSHKCTT